MRIINIKRVLAALAIPFALVLTACTGAAPQELPKLNAIEKVQSLDCAAATNALDRLNAATDKAATAETKKTFKDATGVDPADKKAVKKLRKQLNDREKVACEADRSFTVPANDEDVHASAYTALVNRCGMRFDKSSTVKPTRDDKASYLLKGKGDAVKSWEDYKCTLMRNPTVTDAWAQALSVLKAPSGAVVGELNASWLKPALEKGKSSLAEAWLENRSKTGTDLYVTPDFQKFAFKIITILDRLEKKRGNGTAAWSYELDTFKGVGVPHAVRTEKAYKGKFILLKYTPKGWSCASTVLGINTVDGRPAGLKTYCSPSGKPTGTPPGEKTPPGKHTPSCKGTKCKPSGKCKVNCGNSSKHPRQDPSNRGNTGNGSGHNQDSGRGDHTNPQPQPTTSRSNPASPSPKPSGSPTTAQPHESAAPKPSNPATGCAPAPGQTGC